MQVGVILLAAGSGRRFGGSIPKQYAEVDGRPLVRIALDHLAAEPRFRVVQPVIGPDDRLWEEAVAGASYPFELRPPVAGGAVRSASMRNGLRALPDEVEYVAVHDAARPIPGASMLARLLDCAERHGAAVPGVPLADTVKRVDDNERVLETPRRDRLRAVQTPQVARRDWFEEALALEQDRLDRHSDDASLLEAAGFPVHVSPGDEHNRKITTREDLEWLAWHLARRKGESR